MVLQSSLFHFYKSSDKSDLRKFYLHAHKTTVCQKDSYSVDTDIAVYSFDSVSNVYDFKKDLGL